MSELKPPHADPTTESGRESGEPRALGPSTSSENQSSRPKIDLKKVALEYALRGVPIFPGCPETKQPFTSHGYKDASTDTSQIEAWWAKHPDAIIAMPTGRVTNSYVIDLDSPRAEEELSLLAERANATLPPTHTVKTHRGKHLYFQYSGKPDIGCSVGKVSHGIDVRGDGGYVIVPPSSHPRGGLYEVMDDSPKVELPLWLFGLIVGLIDEGKPVAITECAPRWAWQHYHRTLAELRRAVSGNRNHLLNKAAWWAGRLSGHPLLSERKVREEVQQAARATGLSDQEISSTFTSGWKSGLAARIKILPIHECTDLGNADRFVSRNGDRVRYVPAYGTNGWLVWNGEHWTSDAKKLVRKLAHETVRAVYQEAAAVEDADIRKRLVAWAVKSENDSAVDAMLKEAQPYLAVAPDELDADPELLNLENGTLDLRTGDVREQRPGDLITRMLPVRYEPRATSPVFEKHLALVLPDGAVRDHLFEVIAYSYSGSTSEQCIYIFIGDGSNGKTTTSDFFRNLAGDYGCVVKREFFADGYSGVPPHDVAALHGCRIATCSEFEEGDVLRVAHMKALTSGQSSKVRACRKYGHPFESYPQVKFLLDSNFALKVDSPDLGTWRRIRVIPFTQTIAAAAKDPHIAAKLWAERSGVLNLIIAGLRCWNARGRVLEIPDVIKRASQQYEEESDLLTRFMNERCVTGKDKSIELRAFTREYQGWAREVTTKRKARIGEREMEKRLTARRFAVRPNSQKRAKMISGVGLQDSGLWPNGREEVF